MMNKNQSVDSIISFLYENIDKAEVRYGDIFYKNEEIFEYDYTGVFLFHKSYSLVINKNKVFKITDRRIHRKINLLKKEIEKRKKERESIRKNKDLESFMKKNNINVKNKKSGMLSIADDETGKLSLVKDGTGSN